MYLPLFNAEQRSMWHACEQESVPKRANGAPNRSFESRNVPLSFGIFRFLEINKYDTKAEIIFALVGYWWRSKTESYSEQPKAAGTTSRVKVFKDGLIISNNKYNYNSRIWASTICFPWKGFITNRLWIGGPNEINWDVWAKCKERTGKPRKIVISQDTISV